MSAATPDHALDGESKFGMIVAILAVFSLVSTLCVGLRCYARLSLLRYFGWDDGVLIVGQVLTVATAAVIGLEAHYGLGRHTWTMPDENYIPYMKVRPPSTTPFLFLKKDRIQLLTQCTPPKCFYTSIIIYNIAMCLTKISVLLQFRRIFSVIHMERATRYGLYFLLAWGVTLAFLLPMVCLPVAAFWDPRVSGRCLDSATIWYVMAVVNVVTDFTLVTMPMPLVGALQLPPRQKILLVFMFGIGSIPCAISFYRIKTLRAAAVSQDPNWDNVNAAIFSFLELSVGVIAACLPTMRPLLVAYMPQTFLASRRSRAPSITNTGVPPIRLSSNCGSHSMYPSKSRSVDVEMDADGPVVDGDAGKCHESRTRIEKGNDAEKGIAGRPGCQGGWQDT
ncbi:hypothetical protein B0T22DRAFT_269315 [Podospora appendiculata]|uniref:Rhodopsin domain-containing protein n=1 Tax=Podospora appendiculata TaxID=314037 RepID=A0AAE0X3W2_9PEZI|nr:hypothetical protein B0T22DRAFT_269315 [Podospora appendiculata]